MLGGRARAVGAGLHQPRQIRRIGGHIRLRARPLPYPGLHRPQHGAEFLSDRRVFGTPRVPRPRRRQERSRPRTAAQQRRVHFRRRRHPDGRRHRQPPAMTYDNAAAALPTGRRHTIRTGRMTRIMEDQAAATVSPYVSSGIPTTAASAMQGVGEADSRSRRGRCSRRTG